jgi:hypothetical protein
MTRYAIMGNQTHDLLTYGGRVIVHENKAEMAFLFPTHTVIEFEPRPNDPVMELTDHPDLASTTFPLNRADFKRRV